ncbi:NAD-dependent epimerase/dehydratase family protein [Vibrio maritimus]|uniref:NAD-dependent epimerase/dehydratase family protein n=1 Tax=Vibrio maritimus TaxID=990268 RepID=UPI001F1C99C1|nr:NAD(P)-dependent oxidoreductase [Vibrio maritimus]
MTATKRVDHVDLELIASKLSSILPLFKKKKLFITGGTGFFGKWLLEAINHLNTNYELELEAKVLTRNPDRFAREYPHLAQAKGVSFVSGDVRNIPALTATFDYIIHAATDVPSKSVSQADIKDARSIILDGMTEVVNFAKAVNCQRLLFTSSGAAYGRLPPSVSEGITESFSEGEFIAESDVYGLSKNKAEQYLKEHASCDVVIARCFAFSGPYLPLDGSFAFGNFIADRLNRNPITIQGNGKTVRSYLYAADLVIWLLTMLVKGKDRSIYNVGSDVPVTIRELAESIAETRADVSVLAPESLGFNTYFPSIEKAQKELGLGIYTTLNEAIIKTLNFEK